MTSETATPIGLLLPPGVVQPFFLRFNRDDWHVMAFLDGHPTYEAVEAMAARRFDGAWAVRAIITRHDQSQIDHVNDVTLLAAMRGARRQVTQGDIDFDVDESAGPPQARLSFDSADKERVELRLTAIGPPDPRGAGLTDPGNHSPDVSLPLMWRAASTLAGDGTSVTVAGRRFEPPMKVLRPGFTAREGFMTRGHSLGVIRAGQVRMRRLTPPAAFNPGAQWDFEIEGEEVFYRITEHTAAGVLTIERQGAAREMITARLRGERVELIRVAVPDEGGLTLTFAEGRFDLRVEGAAGLVAGRVEADKDAVSLLPETPDWAKRRVVRVEMAQAAEVMTVTTTVGR